MQPSIPETNSNGSAMPKGAPNSRTRPVVQVRVIAFLVEQVAAQYKAENCEIQYTIAALTPTCILSEGVLSNIGQYQSERGLVDTVVPSAGTTVKEEVAAEPKAVKQSSGASDKPIEDAHQDDSSIEPPSLMDFDPEYDADWVTSIGTRYELLALDNETAAKGEVAAVPKTVEQSTDVWYKRDDLSHGIDPKTEDDGAIRAPSWTEIEADYNIPAAAPQVEPPPSTPTPTPAKDVTTAPSTDKPLKLASEPNPHILPTPAPASNCDPKALLSPVGKPQGDSQFSPVAATTRLSPEKLNRVWEESAIGFSSEDLSQCHDEAHWANTFDAYDASQAHCWADKATIEIQEKVLGRELTGLPRSAKVSTVKSAAEEAAQMQVPAEVVPHVEEAFKDSELPDEMAVTHDHPKAGLKTPEPSRKDLAFSRAGEASNDPQAEQTIKASEPRSDQAGRQVNVKNKPQIAEAQQTPISGGFGQSSWGARASAADTNKVWAAARKNATTIRKRRHPNPSKRSIERRVQRTTPSSLAELLR